MASPTLNALLPEGAIAFIDLIGEKDALALIEHYGGILLYIPRKATSSHKLCDIIALDSLEKLVALYAGTELNVPRCPKLKHLLIIKMHDDDGMSFAKIARALNYTKTWVERVYYNHKKPTQDSLF